MEIAAGHLVAIVIAVVVLAIAAVALTINAMFNALDAKGEALASQVDAIKSAVAAGAEEHKDWVAALDKTNDRLDTLLMHLLERSK